jgi:hypothetical protein
VDGLIFIPLYLVTLKPLTSYPPLLPEGLWYKSREFIIVLSKIRFIRIFIENHGCFRTFTAPTKVDVLRRSGCFPARSRGKRFSEPITSVALIPWRRSSHESSREVIIC